MNLMFLQRLKLFWQLRISNILRIEVRNVDADAMFHFIWAKLMQQAPPVFVLLEIISHMFGDENVSGITAIHYSLRDVDPRACDVRLFVQVSDFIDRAAVNPHADKKL